MKKEVMFLSSDPFPILRDSIHEGCHPLVRVGSAVTQKILISPSIQLAFHTQATTC